MLYLVQFLNTVFCDLSKHLRTDFSQYDDGHIFCIVAIFLSFIGVLLIFVCFCLLQEFGAVSPISGNMIIMDIKRMKVKSTHKSNLQEMACMSHQPNSNVYAVGSKSHVTLFDSRKKKWVKHISSLHKGWGK